MAGTDRKGLAKKIAVITLALGCVTASFGASIYGAYELYEGAQEFQDPYGLGFPVADSDEDLKVDAYHEGTYLPYLHMFGSECYDMYFDHAADDVTTESLKTLVVGNDGIPSELKGRVCEFIDEVASVYPDIDLRVLEHNLADIVIADCEAERVSEDCDEYSSGYYSPLENVIRLASSGVCDERAWEYQVLPHELCHAMRRTSFKDGEMDVSISCQSSHINVVEEAFTSIFACSLLEYHENNCAYQPEVNIVRVMLECVDGYELCDFYRYSLPYFASKLDETCGDHNYAMTMFRMMQAQYDDYHDEEVNRDREAYHPLYDYLARMYLDKHACEGMSPGTVDRLITRLADDITRGVPDSYGFDVGELYRFGQEYYAEKYGSESKAGFLGC